MEFTLALNVGAPLLTLFTAPCGVVGMEESVAGLDIKRAYGVEEGALLD